MYSPISNYKPNSIHATENVENNILATKESINRLKKDGLNIYYLKELLVNSNKAMMTYSISDIKGLKEGVIVIGNESKGISDEIMQLCTEKITIPKTGEAESLNAAVATGIILSHL